MSTEVQLDVLDRRPSLDPSTHTRDDAVLDSSVADSGQEAQASHDKKSLMSGAIFNFVNSIIGAGIIGLAFAVRESGFVMGVGMLVLVAFLTDYTVRLLIRMGNTHRKSSYEDLCEHAFGRRGFDLVSIMMFLFAYGAMLAYFIIIGDTVPKVFEAWVGSGLLTERRFIIAFFGVVFILPLALLKDMASLAWSSGVSVVAVVVIVFIVIIRAPISASEQNVQREDTFNFIEPRFFAGLGAMSFAYVCHHSSFIVYNSLKDNTTERWSVVSHSSVGFALVASLLLAIVGYVSFAQKTEGDILNNFPYEDEAVNVARILLSSTMVFTYPMEHYVARHAIHAVIFRGQPLSDFRRIVITLCLFTSTLILGLLLEDLGPVLELTGAFSASTLGYILPTACYFRLSSTGFKVMFREAIDAWRPGKPAYKPVFKERVQATTAFFVPFLIGVFGVVAMIAGTVTTFTG